ncbi:MAG: rod shape-determining protein MreD [Litorivicinus sp.]
MHPLAFVSLCVLTGWVLTVVPLPHDFLMWWPAWAVLVQIWLALNVGRYSGIIAAWLMGLCLDFLSGSPLGSQAFAMALCIYGVTVFRLRIRNMHPVQQALMVGLATAVFFAVSLWIRVALGHDLNPLAALTSTAISVVAWPLLSHALNTLHLRLMREA